MKIFGPCMIFTLLPSNNICLYLPKLPWKRNDFCSVDNPHPQGTTSRDVCALLCRIRQKARCSCRAQPVHGAVPQWLKIRDLVNSSSNVYRNMIQPRSLLHVFRIVLFFLYIWPCHSASSLPDIWRSPDAAGSPAILQKQESGYGFLITIKFLHFTWKSCFFFFSFLSFFFF